MNSDHSAGYAAPTTASDGDAVVAVAAVYDRHIHTRRLVYLSSAMRH